MYKLDKNTYGTYKEFFFSGIDESGDRQLFESFVYFSYMKEIRNKYKEEDKSIMYMPDTRSMPIDNRHKYSREEVIEQKRQWKKQFALNQKKATGKEILEETIQRAKNIALQYHRFVKLNDRRDVLENYNKNKRAEDEEQLEKRIRKVVEDKKHDGSIQIDDNNVTISRQWMKHFIHYPEYSIPEAQGFIIRNWTEEVYDILCYLEKAEQSEPKGYYDLWLRTRVERFKNEIVKDTARIEELKKNSWGSLEEIKVLERSIIENKEEIEKITPILNKVKVLREKENTVGVKSENPIIKEMDIR